MRHLFNSILIKRISKRFYSQNRIEKNYPGMFIIFLFAGTPLAFASIIGKIGYDKQLREMEYKKILEEQMKIIEEYEEGRKIRHKEWHATDPENYSMEKFREEQREGEEILKSWKK